MVPRLVHESTLEPKVPRLIHKPTLDERVVFAADIVECEWSYIRCEWKVMELREY